MVLHLQQKQRGLSGWSIKCKWILLQNEQQQEDREEQGIA
jgi:hypothetical protein